MNREYVSRLEGMLNRCRMEINHLKIQRIKDKLAVKQLQHLLKEFVQDNFKLKVNLSTEKEKYMCNICFDNLKNVVIVPCYHFVSCKRCASKLPNCPICRSEIESMLYLFG